MNNNMICFDMDGTIADLYGVDGWLDKLRGEDASPYADAEPLVDMEKLNEICSLLQKAGYEIAVITCFAKNASSEYKDAIRAAKRAWLKKWGFIYDHFYGVDYATPKCEVIRRGMPTGMKVYRMCDEYWGKELPEAILVDDESRHTDRWGWGRTIDPTDGDLIEKLRELLPPELREEEKEEYDPMKSTLHIMGFNWGV